MEPFRSHFAPFPQLYLDLPGFGRSTLPFPFTTFEYAEVVAQFLSEVGFTPKLIVAHSFGGKIALLLRPPKLVLLASAGIPLPKPVSVRLKIALFKLAKKVGLGRLRPLFASRDIKGADPVLYETFKRVVDEDFTSYYRNFSGEVVLFGGREDRAVPPVAIEKQGELLGVEPIFLEGDHFFYLSENNLKTIAQKGRELLTRGKE
jgi:pimeloyl-ACP methyl ester carboxylesterase